MGRKRKIRSGNVKTYSISCKECDGKNIFCHSCCREYRMLGMRMAEKILTSSKEGTV